MPVPPAAAIIIGDRISSDGLEPAGSRRVRVASLRLLRLHAHCFFEIHQRRHRSWVHPVCHGEIVGHIISNKIMVHILARGLRPAASRKSVFRPSSMYAFLVRSRRRRLPGSSEGERTNRLMLCGISTSSGCCVPPNAL